MCQTLQVEQIVVYQTINAKHDVQGHRQITKNCDMTSISNRFVVIYVVMFKWHT
jgi:hypothetical protein